MANCSFIELSLASLLNTDQVFTFVVCFASSGCVCNLMGVAYDMIMSRRRSVTFICVFSD